MNVDECKKLYKEYLELKQKTQLHIKRVIPGKRLESQYIDPDNILRLNEIQKKLLSECLECLSLGRQELEDLKEKG